MSTFPLPAENIFVMCKTRNSKASLEILASLLNNGASVRYQSSNAIWNKWNLLLLYCGQCTMAWCLRTRMCVCPRASPEDWQQWGDGRHPMATPQGRWRGYLGYARRWSGLTPHSLLQKKRFQVIKSQQQLQRPRNNNKPPQQSQRFKI